MKRLAFVADSNTFKIARGLIESLREKDSELCISVIPSGEENKSLQTCETLWNNWMDAGLGRNSLIIAFGGGLVCDLSGFCASVYMRGVPFLFFPTSLLAMADASAGGKTGINYGNRKNMLGGFTEASAVFIDTDYLSSLPADERLSGTAEILKHAIIQGRNPQNLIESCMQESVLTEICSTVIHKLEIVKQDFREKGLREVLNLGHTTAHAIEAHMIEQGKPLLHGFAVAAGLWIESLIAELHFKQDADSDYLRQIRQIVSEHYPKVNYTDTEAEHLYRLMSSDKKNREAGPAFSLFTGASQVKLQVYPRQEIILEALKKYAADA